jgi:hypothetical protein
MRVERAAGETNTYTDRTPIIAAVFVIIQQKDLDLRDVQINFLLCLSSIFFEAVLNWSVRLS